MLAGQTNTDFWFAAPEVTSGHGDTPIYLRLTSFGQTANVTISEPANTAANFPVINVTIPANSTNSVNLTTRKDQVECKPPNTALNLGIHIHSDVPITAYYEVANTLNPEIFTLKGNNALGTSFFIPAQSILYNEPSLTPKAYNTFDIVATEDNTTVIITPKKAIVGHAAGAQFTVTLDKGQVYSAQATGQLGVDHLMGSVVTSDKPVAITMKDDSDHYTGTGCYDMTGDQIVPVNIIGSQYIVVRGYTNSTVNDWVFVTATVANTQVSVNGTVVYTIPNAGDSYSFNMTSGNLCTSVQSDHPVYLLHLTGYGCETGSALLPAMDCTGSTQVAFTRTTSFSFEMIVLTKTGAQGSFTVDGNAGIITAADFSTVPGVTGYVYARKDLSVGVLGTGAHILANSQDIFHMGVIHTYDGGQSGCSYGYFTDFASLNLGPDQAVCQGSSVTFNAGPNRQSYQWFYNGTPYATGVQTITVNAPGLYSVTVDDHGCILSDEAQLSTNPLPTPVITGITSFCEGNSQQLSVQGTYPSYLWTTGATTQTITVSASGTYGVAVTDNNGCDGSTSVLVTVHPLPTVTLTQPASTCLNTAPYALTGGSPVPGVYSGTGVNSGTGFFNPSAAGPGGHLITFTYTDAYGCTDADSKTIMVFSPPTVQLAPQAAVCISVPPYLLTGGTPAGGIYSGTGVNSGTGFFSPSAAGPGAHSITYTYTDANGCTNTASKTLMVNALPLVQLANQPSVCISASPFLLTGGTPAGGIYSGTGVNSGTGFFSPSLAGPGGHAITYTYTDANGCINTAVKTLTVNPLPVVQLAAQAGACVTDPPYALSGGSPSGGTYSGWGVNSSTGIFDPSSGIGSHNITYTYINSNGCTNSDSKILSVFNLPVVILPAQPAVCISDQPYALSGGTPSGGTYSGWGVNSLTGIFDPSSGGGLHTITYTYSTSNGCTSSDFKVLTVNTLPMVQLSDQGAICISVPPFILSGGSPAGPGGIYSGTGVNSLTGMFSPSVAGSGDFIITYTYTDANGCSNTASKTITVYPLPVVQLSAQSAVCISVLPFLLTGGNPAGPGGVYSGPGVNSLTGFFDPSSGPGGHLITYTYTDVNGCISTDSKTLTVNPLPLVELAAQSDVCISVPAFPLTGGSPTGSGGVYSGPGVNSVTGYFDPSSGAGPHLITYTYTDANSCISTDSKTLNVNVLPVVQLLARSPVCISVLPFALTGGYPTGAGGVYSGPGVNSVTGFFDPSSGAGNHTITYTFTDANGCSDVDSKILTVYPLPVVQLSARSAVCISVPPFQLTGGTPSGGTFSGPGVNSVTGFFNPSAGAGTHLITYSYTDINGCTNTDSKTLTVNPLPVVQLSAMAAVCITVPPFLLSGGTPQGGTYSGVGVNSSTAMFDPATGSGVHVITYSYTDANTCSSLATSNLTVIPLPLPSGSVSGPSPVCESTQNIPYLLSGTDPLATSFNWEISPTLAGTISGTTTSPLVSLNTGYSGNISIRFQPVSNCGDGNVSGYTNITVNPNPDVWLQSCNDQVTTKGAKPFHLKGGIPPGGVYGIDGIPVPSGILDPASLSPSPPDHIISYTYTNSFNCAISKTQSLKVNNASNFLCKTTLTDIRDMKTYPTFEIIIGGIPQCWMSANLNYGSFIQGNLPQTDNCNIEKYCQGNDVSKCTASGAFYQWDELMNYLPNDNAFAEGKQGLCPPEWHVPTEAEWAGLENYYLGPGLAGWTLTDSYSLNGFHAKNRGILYQNEVWAFMPPGFSATMFWTSTLNSPDNTRIFSHGLNEINYSVSKYFSTRGNALQVRCVKD